MAIDKTDGGPSKASGRGKRHWAYMRYKTGGHYVQTRSGPHWVPATGPKVGRWVKVGSQLYNTLRTKYGVKPIAIRTGKRPNPGTVPSGSGPRNDGSKPQPKGGNGGGGGGGAAGGGAKASGGGGAGGGGRRRKGKGGSSSAQTTAAISKQLGSTKAGQRLGGNYADALAGTQFDAPIHDIKSLIARLGPQNQQAISDLSQWFGDVSTLNARAGDRAGQVAEDVAGNQDQAVQGLMAALGGGANPANQQIAALQANDGAYQRVLGGIEQQYRSDMDPILAHAEASAKQREQRLNLTQMQDYQLQLADLLGQRGQAKAANQMEVDKYNNDLAQQWFQNKLAKLNAALGAQAAGVDMQAKRQGLRLQQQEAKKAKGGPANWKGLNPAERDDLLMRASGAYQKADGTVGHSRTYVQAQRLLSSWLKHPIGSNKNPGLLTALYQYYH